ncbi:FXSXX-COOH protein [Micromonospora sp. NPDC006766]|uniref:FXSXX-COOH protein n=1 Tax=Micromonospora sp. NPDC006766 TaxID=3154778 RepID=UPI0033D5CF40
MDSTVSQPDLIPAPLSDIRDTPLGRISLDRARTVARVDDRRAEQPARVDVASFGSAI